MSSCTRHIADMIAEHGSLENYLKWLESTAVNTKPVKKKFTIFHYAKVPPRNKCEAHIVDWIKATLNSEPSIETLDQAREAVLCEVQKFKHGVTVSDLQVFSQYAQRPHVVSRSFGIFGTGRNTHTILILENCTRDSLDNYKIVD